MRTESVARLRSELTQATGDELRALIAACRSDTRAGVQQAVAAAQRRVDREDAETRRVELLFELEERLRDDGVTVIAGLDEVGRGALAGPLTAAAVIFPRDARIAGLHDSKRLTPERRLSIAAEIRRVAVSTAVAHVPAHVVDCIGMTAALRFAMERALSALGQPVEHAITDGLRVGLSVPETPVVKGDSSVAAVAAASVLAKVERDTLMASLAQHYPHWNLEINKGYGTPDHLQAIENSGLCPLHRRSFSPCAAGATLF